MCTFILIRQFPFTYVYFSPLTLDGKNTVIPYPQNQNFSMWLHILSTAKLLLRKKLKIEYFETCFKTEKKIENSSRPFSEIKIPNRTSTITQTKNLN